MRRTVLLLASMALTLLLASGLALAMGVGSAAADSSVVGPGESIQKAINAADPGDTIVVRGVHKEDVVIRKDGIKLRGDDSAVIEAPAKAGSPCSRAFGLEAICVLGDVNLDTFEVKKRVKDVSVSGFKIRGFQAKTPEEAPAFTIDLTGTRDATVTGNRTVGNVAGGVIASLSINAKVADNDLIGTPKSDSAAILVDDSLNTKVVKNVVKSYPESEPAIDVLFESTNTTIEENDFIGPGIGAKIIDSPGTKLLSNDMSRVGSIGAFVVGQKSKDAKVVGNNISGGVWGMLVSDTHSGSVVGNHVHNNCAGMFFEAFKGEPVGDFKVAGNTVENNTRSCRAQQTFGRGAFSGIGIALLGASGMEVTGNHLSGNIPSGPTAISGGVVVSKDPYFQ